MSTRVSETIYKDRDNTIELVLQEDDVNITEAQMLAITKAEVRYGPNSQTAKAYYNSDDYSSLFDWITYADEAKITMQLGTILPAGKDTKTELIIYNAANTNGIMWSQFCLKVSDEAEVS